MIAFAESVGLGATGAALGLACWHQALRVRADELGRHSDGADEPTAVAARHAPGSRAAVGPPPWHRVWAVLSGLLGSLLGLSTGWLWHHGLSGPGCLGLVLLGTGLLSLGLCDALTQYILDLHQTVVLMGGMLLRYALTSGTVSQRVLGVVVGLGEGIVLGGVLWGLAWAVGRWRQREHLGSADPLLLAALGVLLGLRGGYAALILGSAYGALGYVAWHAWTGPASSTPRPADAQARAPASADASPAAPQRRWPRAQSRPVAFGPYLALAATTILALGLLRPSLPDVLAMWIPVWSGGPTTGHP